MRNVKYLIREAKQSTNTTDAEAITSNLCVRFLNRMQDYVQAYLSNQNIENKLFRGQATFSTVANVDTYQLPFDIYARNSVNTLMHKENNNYSPIALIAEKARGSTSGYFCSDNNIILSPMPTSASSLFLSYTKKLPAIGRSFGKIATVNTGVSIVLDTSYEVMTDVFDDYFSVVDVNGKVIKYGTLIAQTGSTVLMADTIDVLVGMFVVPGFYATTHCQLPDELEGAIIMGLETLINARLSSTDIPISGALSKDQLDQIGEMFAENGADSFTPPIIEYTEWV